MKPSSSRSILKVDSNVDLSQQAQTGQAKSSNTASTDECFTTSQDPNKQLAFGMVEVIEFPVSYHARLVLFELTCSVSINSRFCERAMKRVLVVAYFKLDNLIEILKSIHALATHIDYRW